MGVAYCDSNSANEETEMESTIEYPVICLEWQPTNYLN
jgi:hypothetical protein